MANGESSSEGLGPLVLSAVVIVLVLGLMGAIVAIKPLEFKPVPAATCEGEACPHEGAPSSEHEAPPPASGAHQAAPPHGE